MGADDATHRDALGKLRAPCILERLSSYGYHPLAGAQNA